MISIIVPVYNVAPYLSKCLESLIGQTYRDIEILLIDDGSTDDCPKMCDAYQNQDTRMKVIHTENRGLSAARNLGIDCSNGEWIMFVDSDDWVEPGFCEVAYKAAEDNQADLVIFRYIYRKKDGLAKEDKNNLTGIVSAHEAVEHGHPAVWNKLYRRSLFDGIRYPSGRIHEDVAVTHRLVYRARRIVMIEDVLYNYIKRPESISRRRDEEKWRELYRAYSQRYDDLLSLGFPKEKLDCQYLGQSLSFLMRIEPSDDSMYQHADAFVSTWPGNPDELKPMERDALKLWRLNKNLFHCYYRDNGMKAEKSPNLM